jgi:hypothetical protein
MSLSPYGGRLVLGDAAPTSDLAAIQASSDVIQTLADGAVQIVVPAPSLDRLNAIAELCVRDALTPMLEVMDLTARPVSEITLSDFIAQVEALPDGAIPPACAADLLTVAAAIQSR